MRLPNPYALEETLGKLRHGLTTACNEDALTLLEPETTYLALMATHMAVGRPVEKYDAARMRIAAGRVALIRGMCS